MKKILFALTVSFTWTVAFSQNVGVGTNTPVEKLDVAGNIKTTGEIKPNGAAGQAGQVLTSNGNGTMQWAQSAATGGNSNGNGGWGDCSIYNIDSFRVGTNMDPQPGDYFGNKVSISGDYAIVGAQFDDEAGFSNAGSASIFKFNPVTVQWDMQQKLNNANPAADEYFGASVAISGDYAIIGAYGDDDGVVSNSGSVTIYKRNSTTGVWESLGKIVNPTPATSDNFGISVAISGDYAMVGAPDDEEVGFTDNGSVTMLRRNAGTGVWENIGKLLNLNLANADRFGASVSISGDYAIVGAPLDNENALAQCGSVCIFKRNAIGIWENQGKLTHTNAVTNDRMGQSVSISGDYAIAGIFGDDLGGAITADRGSAIIYKRNSVSGVWESQGEIYNANPADLDYFGSSVSISGDYAIVGSYEDDENGGVDNGTVTVFKRFGSIWYPHQKFTNPGSPANDNQFGYSVSMHNNRFIVGAIGVSGKGMVFFGTAK